MYEKKLKSGHSLPALGLGTWLMGGDLQRKVDSQNKADITAIRQALDMGYSHIDTAEIYGDGLAEEIVGEAIQHCKRENIFIATKAKHGSHDKVSLPLALEKSLKRLNTDYIDLYYLHRPTLETPLEETAEALNKLYEQGKIKNVGVCNFSIQNFDILQSYLKMKIMANQVHYNLAFREPETVGMLEHAEKNDYFVVAWRPLRLVKRNESAPLVGGNVWDKGAFPVLDKISEKYGKTNVQVALSWLLHHSNVCTLIKSSNKTHLEEALGGFFEMNDSDYQELKNNFIPQYATSDTIPLI